MLKITAVFVGALVFFSACAGSGAASRNAEADTAEEAARAALEILDGGGTSRGGNRPQAQNTPPEGASPASAGGGSAAPVQEQKVSGTKPAWVDNPDAVFPRQRYISVVGYGTDRNQAERDALGKLTGIFGQSIQADLKTISSYSEAVKSGAIQISENTSVQNAITTSAEMDTLVGAEIAETWFDGGNTYYAAAVMEREKTATLYADLIHSNERIIGDLTDMVPQEKNTLDGYSRYLLAGTIADANRAYANVLTVVGDTRGIDPAAMKNGDDYRLEAAAVARNIPIGVTVTGDRGDRIKGAFSRALSDAGFRSGGTNSRYLLRASYSVTEVELPGQTNKFVRYQLNAGLADTTEGDSVLVPYSASGREGHLTLANAEERALQAAERRIPGEFEEVLKKHLASLVSALK